jgi:hypothetical protein
LLVIILDAQPGPSRHSWRSGFQKSFARHKSTAPMIQLSLDNYVLKAGRSIPGDKLTENYIKLFL